MKKVKTALSKTSSHNLKKIRKIKKIRKNASNTSNTKSTGFILLFASCLFRNLLTYLLLFMMFIKQIKRL